MNFDNTNDNEYLFFYKKFHNTQLDVSTRYKLALVNEKLSRLERRMEYVESVLQTVSGGGGESTEAESTAGEGEQDT